MAWGKLSSVTGDGSSTTLTTGTIEAGTFVQSMLYTDTFVSGKMLFNSDSGSNYARRYSGNGAGDTTNTGMDKLAFLYDLAPALINMYIVNISGEEKLVIGWTCEAGTAGAGTAPNRMELVFKWANTSAQITDYTVSKNAPSITTSTNLTVLGSDITPAAAIPAPTNVQDNSLFIEPSTARRYWGSVIGDTGLKAYYKFNASSGNIENKSTSSDTIGSSGDMAITGATSVTGIIGNALSFDGTNDYGNIPTSPMTTIGTGDFGISFWVKTDDFAGGGAPCIMGSYDASSVGGAHWQLYESGGAIKLSDGSTTITTSITGIEDNAWHHIVLTRSGSTVTAYKDGSSVSTHTYAVDFPSPSTYLRIAQRGDSNQYCDAELDELSFWNRTLTGTDVTALYNSGGGKAVGTATWTMNPTYETDFSTSTGWSTATSNLNISSNRFNWSVPSGTTSSQVVRRDMGLIDPSKWLLRCMWEPTSATANSDGTSLLMNFGFSDSAVALTASQDSITWQMNNSSGTVKMGINNIAGGGIYNGTVPVLDASITAKKYYIELSRDGDVMTGKSFTDAGFSVQNGVTQTKAIDTSITDLRYLIITEWESDGSTNGTFTGHLDDIQFYNGVTTPN